MTRFAIAFDSPVGRLAVAEANGAIVAICWSADADGEPTPLLGEAQRQLTAYFGGRMHRFDLPLAPSGTAYRRRVWQALCGIPYGQTRTYADIAAVAGGVARSVGQANGSNPIPIFIPCHRVVASAGLGGYSGGDGLDTKRYLLELEATRTTA